MEDVSVKLNDALNQAFTDLKNSGVGTEEYEAARKNVDTLYKLQMEDNKVATELSLKEEEVRITEERNLNEIALKAKQEKREKIQTWLGIGTTIGSLIFYGWGLSRITKFEETGVVTSKTFNLLPRPLNLLKK